MSLDDPKLAQLIGNRQKHKATATTTKFFSQIAQTSSTNVTTETSPCHTLNIFQPAKCTIEPSPCAKPATSENFSRQIAQYFSASKVHIRTVPLCFVTEIPNSDYLQQPEVLEKYLPWSSDLPDRCRLSHNYKKCLK